jgi:hypothetical protein
MIATGASGSASLNDDVNVEDGTWGAIHQLLSIILKLGILVLLPVSTMPYVVIVKNNS